MSSEKMNVDKWDGKNDEKTVSIETLKTLKNDEKKDAKKTK